MVNRILEILKYKKLTASKLADEIGVQRSSISHILSERNKPSLEFIQKILNKYTEINSEWLLTGKNNMLNTEPDLFSDAVNSEENDISERIIVKEKDVVTNVNTERLHNDLSGITNVDTLVNSDINFNESVKDKVNVTKSVKKEIDRIIVFYTDKTFSEYTPE